MNSLRVGRGGQEQRVRAEGERVDGDAALDAAAELKQLGPVRHAEHADDGALLRRRRQLRPG